MKCLPSEDKAPRMISLMNGRNPMFQDVLQGSAVERERAAKRTCSINESAMIERHRKEQVATVYVWII
jgi:hypothetical protein